MNIYEKLMEVRVKVLDEKIKKTGHNKFSNFWYHELKDFLSFTTRTFKDIKLYGKFSIEPATSTKEETAIMKVVNSENPEEIEIYTIPTAECFIGRKKDGTGGADPIQNLGGKITYLRRYMYFLVLDLIEDDSVDSKDTTPQVKTSSNYKNNDEAVETERKKGLAKIMGSLNKDENKEHRPLIISQICNERKVDKWSDITFDKTFTYKVLLEQVISLLNLAKAGI